MRLTIGLFAEGTSDDQFLSAIIQRTFDEVGAEFERGPQLDVPPPIPVKGSGDDFPSKLLDAARNATRFGVQLLCVHVDSDKFTTAEIDAYKLTPGFAAVHGHGASAVCRRLVPLVPVRAMEAWMLADKDLFRQFVGTPLSNQQLGLGRPPERYPRPKDDIAQALRIAQQARKGKAYTINDLYAPMGDQLSLDKLYALDSYRTFRKAVREALEQLGYLS